MIDDFLPSKAPKKHHIKLEKIPKPEPVIQPTVDETIEEPISLIPDQTNQHVDYDVMKNTPNKNSKSQSDPWYKLQWPPGRKEWIVLVVFLLIFSGVVGALVLHHPSNNFAATVPKIKAKIVLPPATKASPLSGVQVSPANAALPVTGVMIENSDAARPQSGLSQAGVVYEAIAEGGITRFLALFQENQPSSVGPIRSARPYYVDALLPFDAAYAHVGGSPDGLSAITQLHVKDLNQFYNGGSYTRITTRAAPHNVYTSLATLIALEKSKGWTSSSFTGFPRKVDMPIKTPTSSSIDLAISSADFNVHYDYIAAQNSYNRSEAGAAMVDALNNQQLSPKVVIAMVVPWSYGVLDASGAYYTVYSDIGSGVAYIFQDGSVTTGNWNKTSQSSQVTFTNADGSPIKLNAGQTWITAVGKSSNVTYH